MHGQLPPNFKSIISIIYILTPKVLFGMVLSLKTSIKSPKRK